MAALLQVQQKAGEPPKVVGVQQAGGQDQRVGRTGGRRQRTAKAGRPGWSRAVGTLGAKSTLDMGLP